MECSKAKSKTPVFAVGDLNSNLVALCTCPKGHTHIHSLSHHLFDALYTSALSAFDNGFYSESVLSFTASLERTYEFFIRATLMEEGLSMNQVDGFWKEISSQSERQYGAFCLQYARFTKSKWRGDSNQVGFRNKVIHKGHVASRKEVESYASYTTRQQNVILKCIVNDYRESCNQVFFAEKERFEPTIREFVKRHKGYPTSSGSHMSFLGMNDSKIETITFQSALEEFQKTFQMYSISESVAKLIS